MTISMDFLFYCDHFNLFWRLYTLQFVFILLSVIVASSQKQKLKTSNFE